MLTSRSVVALGIMALLVIASIALYSSYYSGVAASSSSRTIQGSLYSRVQPKSELELLSIVDFIHFCESKLH